MEEEFEADGHQPSVESSEINLLCKDRHTMAFEQHFHGAMWHVLGRPSTTAAARLEASVH